MTARRVPVLRLASSARALRFLSSDVPEPCSQRFSRIACTCRSPGDVLRERMKDAGFVMHARAPWAIGCGTTSCKRSERRIDNISDYLTQLNAHAILKQKRMSTVTTTKENDEVINRASQNNPVNLSYIRSFTLGATAASCKVTLPEHTRKILELVRREGLLWRC